MNDIYEHKAKKYKYKYLELKKRIEYIGEGGIKHSETYNNCKKDCKIDNDVNYLKYKFGYITPKLKECIEKCKEDEKIDNLPPEEKKRLQEEKEAARIKQEEEQKKQEEEQKKQDADFRRQMLRDMEHSKEEQRKQKELKEKYNKSIKKINEDAEQERTQLNIQELSKYQEEDIRRQKIYQQTRDVVGHPSDKNSY